MEVTLGLAVGVDVELGIGVLAIPAGAGARPPVVDVATGKQLPPPELLSQTWNPPVAERTLPVFVVG